MCFTQANIIWTSLFQADFVIPKSSLSTVILQLLFCCSSGENLKWRQLGEKYHQKRIQTFKLDSQLVWTSPPTLKSVELFWVALDEDRALLLWQHIKTVSFLLFFYRPQGVEKHITWICLPPKRQISCIQYIELPIKKQSLKNSTLKQIFFWRYLGDANAAS